MESLKIGVIGYGMIGKIHTMAYLSIPLYSGGIIPVKLTGVCCGSEESCQLAMQSAPFEWSTTDYRKLLANDEVDVVSICSPNHLHREMVIEALKHRKHIYAEKPLALNREEAVEVVELARHSPVHTAMALEYRFVPAVMRAKQLIEAGALGKIFHFRMVYYRSKYMDETLPLTWRRILSI